MKGEIIDFTNCQRDAYSYKGSDNKKCVYYNGKYYMLKFPAKITKKRSAFQADISSSHFSEYIGSHIFKAFGIEAQNTLLGLWNGEVVVACEDFRGDGEQLHEFSWYMQDIFPKHEIGRIPTYEQLYRVFNESPLLASIKQEAIDRYWDIVVVDALIGNFDRHADNFGYLVNIKGDKITIKNAPVYDCGSCLFPDLSEDMFEIVLGSSREMHQRIYEYPRAALSKGTDKNNEDKFSYFELLSSNIDKNCAQAFWRIYERIEAVLEKIYEIVENTPFISDERIDFYKKMLRSRKCSLFDHACDILLRYESTFTDPTYFRRCKTLKGFKKDHGCINWEIKHLR